MRKDISATSNFFGKTNEQLHASRLFNLAHQLKLKKLTLALLELESFTKDVVKECEPSTEKQRSFTFLMKEPSSQLIYAQNMYQSQMHEKALEKVSEYFKQLQEASHSNRDQMLHIEFQIMKAKILLELAEQYKKAKVIELHHQCFDESRITIDSLKERIIKVYGMKSEKYTNALVLDNKYHLQREAYLDAYHIL